MTATLTLAIRLIASAASFALFLYITCPRKSANPAAATVSPAL